MNAWLEVAAILFGLVATALYSGAETAFYCVSRARIDVEARQGHRGSRLVQRLLADDTAFVIVLMIGINLMLETMTWAADDLLRERGLQIGRAHV